MHCPAIKLSTRRDKETLHGRRHGPRPICICGRAQRVTASVRGTFGCGPRLGRGFEDNTPTPAVPAVPYFATISCCVSCVEMEGGRWHGSGSGSKALVVVATLNGARTFWQQRPDNTCCHCCTRMYIVMSLLPPAGHFYSNHA